MKENDEEPDEYLEDKNNLNKDQKPSTYQEMNIIQENDEYQQPLITNQENKGHKRMESKLDKTIKDINIKEMHRSYLYNIKEYIFILVLLISSSINFSYLYLPFIFVALIIYIFLSRNNHQSSKKCKLILEIITLIYAILLTIFKIVFIILIKNDISFIKDNKDFFLDLGICYLRDEDSKFYFLMTFLGESIVIFFSLYSIIISRLCNDFRPLNDTSIMENDFWTTRNLIMLNYIFILFFATFNISFLTLYYMCAMQFIFFLDSLTNNRKKFQTFFKAICIILITLIIIQLIAINVLNIPTFQKDILYEDVIIEEDDERVFSLWTKIGINYAYHRELIYILKEWLGYFFGVCSLLTLNFAIKTIKANEFVALHKDMMISSFRNAKTMMQQKNEEEKKVNPIQNAKVEKIKNCLSIIYKYIKEILQNIYNFIISPTFIIQFSRIMSIVWIYFYRNFYSLGIFITLFFSFLFINTKSNKYLTIILLAPLVFISLICFHFSNINGYFEDLNEMDRVKYLHLGLGKYQYSFFEYSIGNIFYIFIMFLIYSFFNAPKVQEKSIKNKNLDFINEDENENEEPLINGNIINGSNQISNTESKVEIVVADDKKKDNKRTEDLTFINIILKAIFTNIDKITLIVMYFVAVKSINLVHLILVIIFLIQILLPNKIQNLFEIILVLLQLIFLFEILADILKVYYIEEFNDNKDFINFILIYSEGLSDNNIELFIYGVVYCFYFQYQTYNFPFLKKIIENKEITLGNYVEEKFRNYERIKHILFIIGNIILELYIWILIGLFVFTSCFFEINLIFSIKLAWFFVLSYQFLKTVQSPENGAEYSTFWQALFLAFCCINTLSVYLYQFISDSYINLYYDIKNSTNFFIINLPNIGFTMYNRDDLYYNFLPHFGLIFISVLFIWEVRSQYKKLSKKYKNIKSKTEKKEQEKRAIELQQIITYDNKDIIKEEEDDNDIITNEVENKVKDEINKKIDQSSLTLDDEILYSKKYEENQRILRNLSIRLFLVNIMRIITKFYFLLLFLTIGIIFRFYDLSYSMIIYIIIFGITFIFMFYRLITRLTKYVETPSYFISKVIRYSLVEVPRHIQQNKHYRSIAFRYLLSYSFIFFILLYLYGVFDLFQNGCNNDFFKGCEERHKAIFENNGSAEAYIKAYSYLFGIYLNIREEGLMNAAWIHILLSALIGFDVYAQKLENKFTEDSKEIKAEIQKFSNENSELYHFTKMHDNNILIKIGILLAEIDSKSLEENIRESILKVNEEINEIRKNSRALSMAKDKNMNEQQEEDEINGVNTDENLEENKFMKNKTIKMFINIFSKSNDNQQTLSDTNNSTKLLFFIKKIVEEIIIFLLICIALTKLNIISFIYLIYSAYLTKTRKTMMKFYILYCFLLVSIFFQSIIYISNISEKTCPRPNKILLDILREKLKIPWYSNHLNLQDKYAFFYGFGVNKLQVSLILLEFAQIMVIYIYLDFFSFSIYQDVKNKGETKAAQEKFNFAAIKLPAKLKGQVTRLDYNLFCQYRDCLRNNFNLDIGETLKDFMEKLNIKKYTPIKTNKEDGNQGNKNEKEIIIENKGLKDILTRKKNFYKMRERNRREGTDNIPESDYVKALQEILYLYLHCFILLIIIIISLMITGMISIFYIVICFYYLINSEKIFSGQKYGYPMGIKKILKVCVIIDITIQTIYQIPYISPDQNSVLQKIFDVLGFIKLIDYEVNGTDIEILSNGVIEVIGKPLIYLFLSLQVIIYTSKYFKAYYVAYLIKQKNDYYKNSLINSFLFNNRRIEAFNNSINLRLESEKAMTELKYTLEDWNKKLYSGSLNKKEEKKFYEQPKERPLDFIRSLHKNDEVKEDEEKEEKKEEEKEDKKEEKKEDKKEEEIGSLLFNINKKNEAKIDDNQNENENQGISLLNMFKNKQKKEKEEADKKYVEAEKVKELIIKKLLGGYITKFYIWFNKHSSNYRTMEDKNKVDYEKNSILGYLDPKCYLENDIEKQLRIMNLSEFNEKELALLEDLIIKYKKGKIDKIIEDYREAIFIEKYNEFIKQNKNIIVPIKEIKNKNGKNKFIIEDNNLLIRVQNTPIKYKIDFQGGKVDINQLKFKQFINLLDTRLFKIYLTNFFQIKSILLNLPNFISNNFDYFCYIIMIIEHMINASFLTMFYPLSIFCYALLENPHPKKIYWQTCIIYTIFVLCVKFFFQLKLFNTIFDKEKYIEFLDTLYYYKVGISYFEVGFGIDFLNYIAFDAFVLIILAINRNILISNGLWDKREEEIENIYEANERIQANKDRNIQERSEMYKLIFEYTNEPVKPKKEEKKEPNSQKNEILINDNSKKELKDSQEINNINNIQNEEKISLIKKEKKSGNQAGRPPKKQRNLKFRKGNFEPRYDEANRKFFEKLFPRVRNEKPGADYYPFYAIVLALIIIYILFFFTKMDQDKTYGPVDLDTTQFSGNMVLFLLLHVIMLVYDRAIYISQNKSNLRYRYFIYKKNEKGEGEILSKEEYQKLKNDFFKEENENEDEDEEEGEKKVRKPFFITPTEFEQLKSDNYNLFYVQIEYFNKPLLHKYILQIFSAVICHIFIFVYFPMKGNFNLVNTIWCIEDEECNDFINNIYIVIFYILYLIYLFLSSIQIRLGYFDIKRKSLFKQNTTLTNIIAKIFNAIPFLPNIRNTIDWTFTSTCLDLFQWNKFESIYDTIFDTYCDSEGDEKPIGEKVGKKQKIIMGGLLSFVLVFILVIPLVLFSSLNPTNEFNNLTGAKLNVDLTFTYENDVVLNYHLFENSRAKTINNMINDTDGTWESYEYDKSVQTRNFNKEQIQIVKFSETSDRNWDLAEPHINNLIDLLNIAKNKGLSNIDLNILTEFDRRLPAEAQTVSKSFTISIYDSSEDSREGINKTLELKNAIENCKPIRIEFEEGYYPPVRVTAGEEISEIEDEKYIIEKPIRLGFQGCRLENKTNEEDIEEKENIEEANYLRSYFTFETKNKKDQWEGLEFHVFNDKISETTSGYSVLTFYLTFILVAGSYVQDFLASEPEKIMFTELPHPKPIVDLCEGIKISRYSYDFRKEEELFTILIDLMRSPDLLKKLTQSSIDDFKKREEEENKNKEDESEDKEGEKKDDNDKDKKKKKKDLFDEVDDEQEYE